MGGLSDWCALLCIRLASRFVQALGIRIGGRVWCSAGETTTCEANVVSDTKRSRRAKVRRFEVEAKVDASAADVSAYASLAARILARVEQEPELAAAA